VFGTLVSAIRSCQEEGVAKAEEDAALLAAEIWAALHGQVLLRLNAPKFPWPAGLEEMADLAVARLVGLDLERTDQSAGRRRPPTTERPKPPRRRERK
jgi:hypothetical protein